MARERDTGRLCFGKKNEGNNEKSHKIEKPVHKDSCYRIGKRNASSFEQARILWQFHRSVQATHY